MKIALWESIIENGKLGGIHILDMDVDAIPQVGNIMYVSTYKPGVLLPLKQACYEVSNVDWSIMNFKKESPIDADLGTDCIQVQVHLKRRS